MKLKNWAGEKEAQQTAPDNSNKTVCSHQMHID